MVSVVQGTWRCLLLLIARVIQPKHKPRVSPRTEKSANLAQISPGLEKDRAIEQIAAVERVPNTLGYGLLKLHPYWDPLRGDPRFEKIGASVAPK